MKPKSAQWVLFIVGSIVFGGIIGAFDILVHDVFATKSDWLSRVLSASSTTVQGLICGALARMTFARMLRKTTLQQEQFAVKATGIGLSGIAFTITAVLRGFHFSLLTLTLQTALPWLVGWILMRMYGEYRQRRLDVYYAKL